MNALALGFVCLLLYFLPSLIGRNKRNSGAILALNLLLGWTVVGWVVSLVWALTVDPEIAAPSQPSLPQPSVALCCPVCRNEVEQSQKFCPACGVRMAWPA